MWRGEERRGEERRGEERRGEERRGAGGGVERRGEEMRGEERRGGGWRGEERRGEERRGEERRGEEREGGWRGEERRGDERRGEERREEKRLVLSFSLVSVHIPCSMRVCGCWIFLAACWLCHCFVLFLLRSNQPYMNICLCLHMHSQICAFLPGYCCTTLMQDMIRSAFVYVLLSPLIF